MNLAKRIARLEAIEAIRARMSFFADRCDNGGSTGETYDAVGMANLWTADGRIQNGASVWHDRTEILGLLQDLAQTLSLHFNANYIIDVDPDRSRASGHWYVWEAPILSGKAVWGCFTHNHIYRKENGEWFWELWHQTEHYFTPIDKSWEEGARVMEQRTSFGA
jgi:hypothetical protein